MQEHVAAVQGERPRVVRPRLLHEAAVGLHQRRKAADLRPAHQELGRAAVDPARPEVAADVVRPVREAAVRRRHARGDERPQRPEVARLVAAPQRAGRLLAAPAAATEHDAAARPVHLVERALHRAPVQAAEPPGRRAAARAVREARVLGHVPALAVVGLDALDAERERRLCLPAPPRLGGGRGEVDHRPAAHPPAPDVRVAVGAADEVPGGGALVVVRARARGAGAASRGPAGSGRRASRGSPTA